MTTDLSGHLEMVHRTVNSTRGYVFQDLLEASSASIEDWIDLFLGISPAIFRELYEKIGQEKWFCDNAIQEHMKTFCYAKGERRRRQPTIDLFRRILEMARDAMKISTLWFPVGDSHQSFTISDVHIVDSSDHPVLTPENQGDLGAKKRPDLLVVRERADKIPVPWTKVLS